MTIMINELKFGEQNSVIPMTDTELNQVFGGVGGGLGSIFSNIVHGKDIDWADAGAWAAGGAIGGGIAGAGAGAVTIPIVGAVPGYVIGAIGGASLSGDDTLP